MKNIFPINYPLYLITVFLVSGQALAQGTQNTTLPEGINDAPRLFTPTTTTQPGSVVMNFKCYGATAHTFDGENSPLSGNFVVKAKFKGVSKPVYYLVPSSVLMPAVNRTGNFGFGFRTEVQTIKATQANAKLLWPIPPDPQPVIVNGLSSVTLNGLNIAGVRTGYEAVEELSIWNAAWMDNATPPVTAEPTPKNLYTPTTGDANPHTGKGDFQNAVRDHKFPKGSRYWYLGQCSPVTTTTVVNGITTTTTTTKCAKAPYIISYKPALDPSGSLVINIGMTAHGHQGMCHGGTSPIMLFTDDKRPQFTGKSKFPIHGDIPTVWPEPHAPGAFLVADLEGNGKIVAADQLFGDRPGVGNGFESLKNYDSNHDNIIDARDQHFDKLFLWRDDNGDGVSQPSELQSLKAAHIESLDLAFHEPGPKVYIKGAEGRQFSTFKFKDKKGQIKTGEMIDVWLDPANLQ